MTDQEILNKVKRVLKNLRELGIASGHMKHSCCWSCTGSRALRKWGNKKTITAVAWWSDPLRDQIAGGKVVFACKSAPRVGMPATPYKTFKRAFNEAGFRVTEEFGRQYITIWTRDAAPQ